jgi:hypothetical protein
MRAGRLERVKPILLSIETPEHRFVACLGTRREKVHGRRRGSGRAMAGGESALEDWKPRRGSAPDLRLTPADRTNGPQARLGNP